MTGAIATRYHRSLALRLRASHAHALAGSKHSAQALVAAADAQLCAARHAGRNRVCATQLAAAVPAA